jgi:NAD(P)-dependent dehydrogenase (short-subunit alcohol dehydrogenase family)
MTDQSQPLKSLFDLTGQVAIVTGGSRGLGFQMAEALGEYGATVILTARKQNELDAAVAKLTEQGTKAAAFAGDFSKPETVPAFVAWLKAHYDRVDILVNNAGTSWGSPAEDHPIEAWNKVFATNLTGPFQLTQAVAKEWLIPQKRGRVINIASVEGLQGHHVSMGGMVGYSAAKGGMVNLTRALAAEWGRYGITVNAIAPGYVDTEMVRAVPGEVLRKIVAKIPVGRLGHAEDIARGVAFLTADDADFVTGSTMSINGGMHMY